MTLILAHAGHWTVSLLYLTPVVVLVGVLAFAARRDRRMGGTDDPTHDPTDEPSLDDIMEGKA